MNWLIGFGIAAFVIFDTALLFWLFKRSRRKKLPGFQVRDDNRGDWP